MFTVLLAGVLSVDILHDARFMEQGKSFKIRMVTGLNHR